RVRQGGCTGCSRPCVGRQDVAEERRQVAFGAVAELLRDDGVAGLDLLLHAADAADRDDPLDAERLQPPDVGAEIQLARRQPMAVAVARQEDHAPAIEPALAKLVGRIAERRSDTTPANVRHPFQLVEPAAADDADRGSRSAAFLTPFHVSSPLAFSPSIPVIRTLARRRRNVSGPSNVTST